MFSRSREKTRRRRGRRARVGLRCDFPGAGGQQAHEGPSRSRLPRAVSHSRVLHFQLTVGAPGAVGRAEALRDDPLAAERADVLKHDRALATVVLVENDAVVRSCGSRNSVASAALRCSTGVRRRSSPCNSIRSKAQHRRRVVPVAADQVEDGEPIVVAHRGLAIDQAGAHPQQTDRGRDGLSTGHCRHGSADLRKDAFLAGYFDGH
jgi:hypothetical protein